MPRGDGTGPMGAGSMTGRGAGYCTGNAIPGFANNAGAEFARGIGGGRGFRRMFCRTGFPFGNSNGNVSTIQNSQAYDEKSALKNQEKILKSQLEQIRNRLDAFNTEK